MSVSAARLDPRTTLARPDLAELGLEAVVRAQTFRAVRRMHCAAPVADLLSSAQAGDRIDQLIFGEAFDALDQQGDHAWGRARRDGVVGWVALSALKDGAPSAFGVITEPGGDWPLNALVADAATPGASPIGQFAADPVAVAESLLGIPHELGARSSLATDCAGLVQQCLYACGLAGPRYADQQAQLGREITRVEAQRGDLALWLHPEGGPGWTGHSAFMLDAERVINASGDKGGVVMEPFAEADARYRADGFTAPVFRRL